MVWFNKLVNPEIEKRCSRCHQWLPKSEFYKDSYTGDSLSSWCKACKRATNNENREVYLARKRRYREENKDKILAYAKKYQQEHKEQIREYTKKYQRSEHGKAVRRQIRERHKHKLRRKYREYMKTAQGKRARCRSSSRYRARKQKASHTLTDAGWQRCLEYFGFQCAICGISEEESIEQWNTSLHRAHALVPLLNGGGYDTGNIIPLCTVCNGRQGTGIVYNICTEDTALKIQTYFTEVEKWMSEKSS